MLEGIKVHLETSVLYLKRHEMSDQVDITKADHGTLDMSAVITSDAVLIHGEWL